MPRFRQYTGAFHHGPSVFVRGGGRWSAILATVVVSFFPAVLMAKEKPKTTIRVVETQSSSVKYVSEVAGSPAKSTTNCNVNTGYGAVINGNVNCETISTPATTARREVTEVPQANVLAVMPDGKHITLWCQRGFRKCAELDKGNYDAEIDGNTIWVDVPEFSGKILKIKYRYAGSW